MKARSVAREIAVLLHYGGGGSIDLSKSAELPLKTLITDAVRSLIQHTQEELQDAASAIRLVVESVQHEQNDHPDNEDIPFELPTNAVPISNTQELMDKLITVLNAADNIQNALHWPEFVISSKEEHVQNYVAMLLKSVQIRHDEITSYIGDALVDWRPERLIKMDRSILELATAELLTSDAVEKATVLDEFIELSKRYCEEESYKLINATLSTIADKIAEKKVSSLS